MGMRLLTPPQGKSRRELENVDQELRAVQLDKVIVDKRKEIQDLDSLMVKTLSEQGAKNYEEEQAWKDKITQLTTEVEALESRKRVALQPIQEREGVLKTKEEEVLNREKDALLRESTLNYRQQALETGQNELQRQEIAIKQAQNALLEQTIKVSQDEKESFKRVRLLERSCEELESKEAIILDTVTKLALEVSSLREERRTLLIPIETREKALNQRADALSQKEASLLKKEGILTTSEAELATQKGFLDRKEDELLSRETSIRDRELALTQLEDSTTSSLRKEKERLSKSSQELQQKWSLFRTENDTLNLKKEELENYYKTTLIPLEKREKLAQSKEEALLKREEELAINETNLEQTRELLEDKLDAVSVREQDANDYSLILNNREENIKLQESQIRDRMTALTEILKESMEEVKKSQSEAAEYKATLKGRDVSLTEREKRVQKEIESVANREARLVDRYRTLQKAITETNLKNGLKHNN